MSVTAGTRLGPYEIGELLGAGGMGQVFKARDTRLGRDVALKVLPADLVGDPERRRRFEHEARTTAALNHPHIVALYDVGLEGDTFFVVTELLSGTTLRQLLERERPPVRRAIEIASQVAAGLAAAHAHGTIHRDVKPDNIFISSSGQAKILDFGLATASNAGAVSENAPTLMLTAAGTVAGTPAYMAPEQVRGERVDHRADIFALGCVLYEMLTGRRPFLGATAQDTMSAILRDPPPPIESTARGGDIPAALCRVVERCLDKTPDGRFQSTEDLAFALKTAGTESGLRTAVEPPAAPASRGSIWRIAIVAALGLITGAAGAALILPLFRAPVQIPGVTRFVIPIPPVSMSSSSGSSFALTVSPDGRSIAYTSQSQLFVRRFGEFEATRISGPANISSPAFSPDGRWIAFGAGGRLQKVAASGGPVLTICDAAVQGRLSWSGDDLVFVEKGSRILRVRSDPGSTPELIVSFDDARERVASPTMLPGGGSLLFTYLDEAAPTLTGIARAQLMVYDIGARSRHPITRGIDARYLADSGYLVYGYDNALLAVPFDPASRRLANTQATVATEVAQVAGRMLYDVAASGAIAYLPGSVAGRERRLLWIDRTGQEHPLPAVPRAFDWPKLSPDGRRAVARVALPSGNAIYIYDVTEGTQDVDGTRLSEEGTVASYPIWAPDGQSVVFGTVINEKVQLSRRAATGLGPTERLAPNPAMNQYPYSWTPDGRLLYVERADHMTGGSDIRALALRDRSSQLLMSLPDPAFDVSVSPDGRWILYLGQESGLTQVFVRPFPNVNDGVWKVSVGPARNPRWERLARRLVFVSGSAVYSASFEVQPAFHVTRAKLADLPDGFAGSLDISPDGRRFLALKEVASGSAEIRVMLDWREQVAAGATRGK